jgi:hypothetical protein
MRMDILLMLFLLTPWVSWKWLCEPDIKSVARAPTKAAPTQSPMEFQAALEVQPHRELER